MSEIENPKKFIYENLKAGNDIIINFWLKPVTSHDNGHYMLVSRMDDGKIELCDPADVHKSSWWVPISKAVKGMSKKFDGNERGFVIISAK